MFCFFPLFIYCFFLISKISKIFISSGDFHGLPVNWDLDFQACIYSQNWFKFTWKSLFLLHVFLISSENFNQAIKTFLQKEVVFYLLDLLAIILFLNMPHSEINFYDFYLFCSDKKKKTKQNVYNIWLHNISRW